MNLFFLNTISVQNSNFGGKANNLIAIKNKGFAVPEFVVIQPLMKTEKKTPLQANTKPGCLLQKTL